MLDLNRVGLLVHNYPDKSEPEHLSVDICGVRRFKTGPHEGLGADLMVALAWSRHQPPCDSALRIEEKPVSRHIQIHSQFGEEFLGLQFEGGLRRTGDGWCLRREFQESAAGVGCVSVLRFSGTAWDRPCLKQAERKH